MEASHWQFLASRHGARNGRCQARNAAHLASGQSEKQGGCAQVAFLAGMLMLLITSPTPSGAMGVAEMMEAIFPPELHLVPDPPTNYNLANITTQLGFIVTLDRHIGGKRFQGIGLFSHVQGAMPLTLGSQWDDKRYIMYTSSRRYAGHIGIQGIPYADFDWYSYNGTELVWAMRVGDGLYDVWGQKACIDDGGGGCKTGSDNTIQSFGARRTNLKDDICINPGLCASLVANVNHPASISQLGPIVAVQCQDWEAVTAPLTALNHKGGICFLDVRDPTAVKWVGFAQAGGEDEPPRDVIFGYSNGYIYTFYGQDAGAALWVFDKQYMSPKHFADSFPKDLVTNVGPNWATSGWTKPAIGVAPDYACSGYDSTRYTKLATVKENSHIILDGSLNDWMVHDNKSHRKLLTLDKVVFYDRLNDSYSDKFQAGTSCLLRKTSETRQSNFQDVPWTHQNCDEDTALGTRWNRREGKIEAVCVEPKGGMGMDIYQ